MSWASLKPKNGLRKQQKNLFSPAHEQNRTYQTKKDQWSKVI
jgi:hypothetical protein